MRERAAREVKARLGADRILLMEDGANSFGVESGGRWQIRGNGCLAATADEIMFLLWWPRREVRIPRHAVTGLERARSHLGKTVGHELLRVRFTNDEGRPDSIAWWVRDLPRWEDVLTG
jgi:hypothetical protein